MITLRYEAMTRQSRKKVTCYNFTINRAYNSLHLLRVAEFLQSYSNLYAVGLESKATIGSDHIQGFLKLEPGITYSRFCQDIKSFLKKDFPLACFYAIPVPVEEDSEKCINYACKENFFYIKRENSSFFSKDLTKSANKIIMLLEKNN